MGRNLVRASAMCLGMSTLAACDNSNTLVLDPNPATRVVIDADACPTVGTCATCLLKAEGFDKNGQPASFPTFVWSSSDPSRATVEPTGRVNGWRSGPVTIQVEVLETGATDEVSIAVVANPNIPCNPPAHLAPDVPSS